MISCHGLSFLFCFEEGIVCKFLCKYDLNYLDISTSLCWPLLCLEVYQFGRGWGTASTWAWPCLSKFMWRAEVARRFGPSFQDKEGLAWWTRWFPFSWKWKTLIWVLLFLFVILRFWMYDCIPMSAPHRTKNKRHSCLHSEFFIVGKETLHHIHF